MYKILHLIKIVSCPNTCHMYIDINRYVANLIILNSLTLQTRDLLDEQYGA